MISVHAPLATDAQKPAETQHDPKLVQAAQGFEAFFLSQIMKDMTPKTEGFDQGVYQSMLQDKLSTEMAKQSPLGLAPILLESFEKSQPEAAAHPGFTGFKMTSGFGVRNDPFTQEAKFHHGWDMAAPAGTPVGAQAGGTVSFSGTRDGYGEVVEMTHADGSKTLYGHLQSRDVQVGQIVQPGAIIGKVGSTGRSTGPHLHFEVRRGGQSIDPGAWLKSSRP